MDFSNSLPSVTVVTAPDAPVGVQGGGRDGEGGGGGQQVQASGLTPGPKYRLQGPEREKVRCAEKLEFLKKFAGIFCMYSMVHIFSFSFSCS